VFVNYRGADSHSYGALLYTELARRFGEDQVFLDAESIPAGADFVEELLDRVRSARVLLAVIGPRWLTVTDPDGRRRIDDPADWIHRELAEAFTAGVRVIPVLTDQAELPTAVQLPADIAALSRCQYRRLRYREPTADLARIVTDLASEDPLLAQAARHRDAASRGRSVSAAMFSMRGDIPDFVGRHDELRTLLDTVDAATRGPVRGIAVHTVDGMPGVGKTVFSVHAAHHLAGRFPDGQIFLELHGHSPTRAPRDPADALASLLVATGLDRAALPHEVDDRARLWRDRIAGKKVLLVLDDAASHDQLRPLLPGTPECFVVITSRRRLPGLDGVHPLTLDVLPPDQAARLLLTLAHRDPTTAATTYTAASDPDAVTRVVELCGCLPLAIALAAGRLRSHPTWSIDYLADLLAQDPDRLEHLAAGDRSVQAAFTVSYHHLTPQRQRIFTLLGVHPGPTIDPYALAALADCSLTQARHHLEALHADHLIQETTPGRYQLHDLLRVYAGSLAATADQADTGQATRRVLDYYLYTATTADAHMPDYATPTLTITLDLPAHHPVLGTPQRARAWLDTELATLTTCLEHATAQPDLVIALAATLNAYLRVTDAWDQAHRIHHTALAAAERTHDRLGQATTLHHLGIVYYLRGDYGRAQQVLEHAHRLYTDLGDQLGQANTLRELGIVYRLPGDFGRAQQVLEDTHRLYTDLGDQLGQANTLRELGIVYRLRGDWWRAQQVFEYAHQLFTDLGYRLGQGNILRELGHLYRLRGDLGWAEQVLEQAHQLFTDVGYRLGQGNALYNLGIVYSLRGDLGWAEHVLEQAHQLFTDIGYRLGRANSFLNLGRVHHQKGDYGQALELLTQAHALFADVGDPDGQAETLNSIGDLAQDHPPAGDPHTLFTQAHTLAHTIGTTLHEARALAGLGRCAHRAHDIPTATTAFTQALTLYQRLGSPEAATITGYLTDLHHDTDQHPNSSTKLAPAGMDSQSRNTWSLPIRRISSV
jgi:tetratricopeptide (TPR) repeat protein